MDLRSPSPWVFGGLLTLATVGLVYKIQEQAEGASCRPSVGAGARVLLVGDSLSVGLKTPLGAIATRTGAELLAFAESGTTMRRWLNDGAVSLALQQFNPHLVLVSLGTNDSKGNTPDATLAEQVGQMKTWLTSTGAKLVWILPPKLPFPERVSPAVKAAGIEGFPSAALPIPQPDGIHTSGRGYAGWAEHIWAFLSCAPAPQVALSGLGAAPRRPILPPFMVPARPVQVPGSPSRPVGRRARRQR